MADWVFNAATEKNCTELTIDFINNQVLPNDLEIKPILNQLPKLRQTINKTLQSQNFDSDFITSGVFEIKIGKTGDRYLYCKAVLIDENGIEYHGKEYTETVYEDKFKVFKANIFQKIKRVFIK